MEKTFEISCMGRDNVERTFMVTSGKSSDNRIIFVVRCQDSSPYDDFFQMSCIITEENFRIDMMIDHCNGKYSEKSIPENLIVKVSEIYKKDILSSSSKKILGKPDSLNPFAEKYWKRLESLKPDNVDYDEENGRYKYRCIKLT